MELYLKNITNKFIQIFLTSLEFEKFWVCFDELNLIRGTSEWRNALKISCIKMKKFELFKYYNELSFEDTEKFDKLMIQIIREKGYVYECLKS